MLCCHIFHYLCNMKQATLKLFDLHNFLKPMFYLLLVVYCVGTYSCQSSAVRGLRFGVDKIQMSVGQVDTIELFVEPFEATDYNAVEWHSSDNSVARVDANGVVRAVYSGECVISASYRDKKAEVKVVVEPVSLDISTTKGVLYYYGNSKDNGLNMFILRLLSDGYAIKPDGNIVGAGYYINMELYLPQEALMLENVTFCPSQSEIANAYKVGYIYQNDGNSYVGGSYVGYSSIGSSTAIPIEQGSFKVEKNGDSYIIHNIVKGVKKETIRVSYRGRLMFVDKTKQIDEVIDVEKNSIETTNMGDIYSMGFNVVRTKFSSENGVVLWAEFVVPISATDIPVGKYTISDKKSIFTLTKADCVNNRGTYIIDDSKLVSIIDGYINVEYINDKKIFEIALLSENNKMIK